MARLPNLNFNFPSGKQETNLVRFRLGQKYYNATETISKSSNCLSKPPTHCNLPRIKHLYSENN